MYGCCKIVDNDIIHELSPYNVIPYDEKHTNCPSYKDLINNYNMWVHNYVENYNTTYCKLNTYNDDVYHNKNFSNVLADYDINVNKYINDGETIINCPFVKDILYKYYSDYPDPNTDSYVIICIILFLFFMGISSSSSIK